MSARAALLVSLCSVVVTGCFLDRTGAPLDVEDARVRPPDGGEPDADTELRDARADADPADGGPGTDASGGCAPGFVAVDGDPSNGCECERAADPAELCNGRDDDCDPSTFDGQDDPIRNTPCDGEDLDLCEDGIWVCNVGALACTDPLEDTAELCDGAADEDCDGAVDEAGAADARTWYRDADGDLTGDASMSVVACTQPSGFVERSDDCDDTTGARSPTNTEQCNGRDDDCVGGIDDGACPGCVVRLRGAKPYLFCTTTDSWSNMAARCAGFTDGMTSYHLVHLDDAAENSWVSTEASAVSAGTWWIGLSQPSGSGAWRWTNGVEVATTFWAADEPNDGGWGGNEDCVELRAASAEWNDQACGDARLGICEWP